MGNTCTPEKQATVRKNTEIENKEDTGKGTQPSEKITNIINTYQAENEELKKELESMKNKDEEDAQERKKQAAQNDEIMNELSAMKAAMEEKSRALVKHRLEAALHSKATSMVSSETVTKLLKAGTIEKFRKGSKTKVKEKWVEIHVHSAQTTAEGINKGFVMLTYSDSKTSQLSNRCQIIRVKEEAKVALKHKDKAFSLDVITSGTDKEIAFACEDEKTREEWVRICSDGFDIVEEEFRNLKNVESDLIIDVVFTKPKLGIRVEEKVIETSDAEEKLADVSEDNADAEKKFKEGQPCELVVKVISDESVLDTGLTVGCVVSAINGINLKGLTYDEQVGMFKSTQKPYTITFLKRKSTKRTAFPGILKELVADGDNVVKTAFYDLVKGTPFGIELVKSENKTATITELLSNQRRLLAVLQNTIIPEMEL